MPTPPAPGEARIVNVIWPDGISRPAIVVRRRPGD